MPDDIRIMLKDIVDQLEKNNYAVSDDARAIKYFSRIVPKMYRDKNTIEFYNSVNKGKKLIRIDSNYKLEKFPNYNFILKEKLPKK